MVKKTKKFKKINKETAKKALKTAATKTKEVVKKAPSVVKKAPAAVKKVNIPNLLTMIRIWAIPVIVLTLAIPSPFWAWISVVLFAIAGITDYMDGYLARHLNQLSRFGRVLDPIADKLLVGATLLMLAYSGRLGDFGIVPAVVILCREILVSGLREFLAEINVGCPVTRLAKWKTACQMVALPVLMVANVYTGFWGGFLWTLGMVALWGAAILTVMTGYDYWKSGRKYMDEE
ncbi:MAG: CDP-diacylglycerol--glycerol-3-phosphate 3-phosphatidyltransferase [Alphaproteobacteria bacterium]|nr:CDP-diacylglycerol--glycerol-3-phosphate 3-phosphatidyltransferase [Alphaproteobacteria bacterium]